MTRLFCRWSWAVCLVTLGALGGCAKQPGVKLTDAEGTVKIDGKPAVNVLVQFMPDKSLGNVPGSSGLTDENGHFSMIAADGRKGAVIGKHNVVLANERADERSGKKVVGPPVPEKYTRPGAKTVDVAADKKTYDFDL